MIEGLGGKEVWKLVGEELNVVRLGFKIIDLWMRSYCHGKEDLKNQKQLTSMSICRCHV